MVNGKSVCSEAATNCSNIQIRPTCPFRLTKLFVQAAARRGSAASNYIVITAATDTKYVDVQPHASSLFVVTQCVNGPDNRELFLVASVQGRKARYTDLESDPQRSWSLSFALRRLYSPPAMRSSGDFLKVAYSRPHFTMTI